MIRISGRRAALAAALLALFGSAAAAADFKITAPLKGLCRPDLPPDPCTPFNLFGPPAISGDFVVWTNRAGPQDGIWSYQISTKKIRKLAGFETKAPAGKGKFTAFGNTGSEYPTLIGGETVVFFARDADNTNGLYTANVRGGVRLIANGKTPIPKAGGLVFQDIRWASTNGKTVAFFGVDPNGATGVFRAKIDGSSLKTVIYSAETELDARSPSGPVPGYFGYFSRPLVAKKSLQFYASGLFDPVSGANAYFQAGDGFTDLIDNMTRLQGGSSGVHVRNSAASASDTSSEIAVLSDQPADGYSGIFKPRTLDEALAFVTTKTKVPGAATTFHTFVGNGYGPGFGVDASGLAFTAFYVDGNGNHQDVFFVAKPGGKVLRVARGGADYYLPYVGDRSVSGGVIAFTEGYNAVDTFYIATPK
ncbi:hypothetical protein [Chenggangzhangella methanolivorans]|uniref:Uncharacterized protein n=1 Tax=Chenggangzhangella methanolivorans TaxID=1437009 RepID=A0A9E6R9U1_9HYPH|nr:hypothetical protein [Chenggangzhangella methanolivorans]QZO00779.1 hypothetical protein K6K41_03625 [Chenggangzhangella methanolivorans]